MKTLFVTPCYPFPILTSVSTLFSKMLEVFRDFQPSNQWVAPCPMSQLAKNLQLRWDVDPAL